MHRRVCESLVAKHFGLSSSVPDTSLELLVVESVRTLRRVSPDREHFGIVVEVTQRKRVRLHDNRSYWFHGGSTIVLEADGTIRYAIAKWIDSKDRLERYADYVRTLDAGMKALLRADRPNRSAMYRRLHRWAGNRES